MALRINNVRVDALAGDQHTLIKQEIAQRLNVDESLIHMHKILSKSLDARQKNKIVYEYHVIVSIESQKESILIANGQAVHAKDESYRDPVQELKESQHKFRHRPVIVGSGPCGIFAALILAEAGARPIIVERGGAVDERLQAVGRLLKYREFSPESNYCFGEGGAGTFSDGKLTCSRRHPYIDFLFHKWIEFGAPEQILYDNLPHIGSDNLVNIARNMRSYLLERGATFLFNTTFIGLNEGGPAARFEVKLHQGDVLDTDHLILAIGHAARDTLCELQKFMAMEPKAFAIGVRVEHPQSLIDEIQYGKAQGLPPSSYKLTAKSGNRGVWSFCMCPGGILLPSHTQRDHLAVNGMSFYRRDSGFANAALVVNVKVDDYYNGNTLDGVFFQQALERKAYQWGGGGYVMPAQRLLDFMALKPSDGELSSSYPLGVNAARLDRLLPEFVVSSLQGAMAQFARKMPGFVEKEALLVGVETKTSSPVILSRIHKTCVSKSHEGLYPAGEGAGYAGGIVSAALDGVRVAMAILGKFED